MVSENPDRAAACFVTALRNGDFESMLAKLADNVVLIADGGDKPGAWLRPLEGAAAVARAMLHAAQKHGMAGEVPWASVNGMPGLVRFENGLARAVLAFGAAGGRIEAVFVISNPAKLRHLHRAT